MKQTCLLLFVLALFAATGCSDNNSGEAATTSEAQAPVKEKPAGEEYVVTPGTSVVMWEGYKPTRTHTGTVDISFGKLYVEDGQITAGLFSLDLTSINVTDLEGNSK
ncbi:MAG: hypothetical protein R3330_03710, partial [Saprospiraceae bacterium]|nr:hypothetical protein [Saprospiraceae bacterium]